MTYVHCETAHIGVAAGDRQAVRRQAPHHGVALDQQDRGPAAGRQRIKQDDQQANGFIRLELRPTVDADCGFLWKQVGEVSIGQDVT